MVYDGVRSDHSDGGYVMDGSLPDAEYWTE